MEEMKDIAVNASIDIGDNITSLIEKLAQKMGTAADQVFPWYVKQQIIEGYLWGFLSSGFLILGISMFLACWNKADFDNCDKRAVLSITGIAIAVMAGVFFPLLGLPEQ